MAISKQIQKERMGYSEQGVRTTKTTNLIYKFVRMKDGHEQLTFMGEREDIWI